MFLNSALKIEYTLVFVKKNYLTMTEVKIEVIITLDPSTHSRFDDFFLNKTRNDFLQNFSIRCCNYNGYVEKQAINAVLCITVHWICRIKKLI